MAEQRFGYGNSTAVSPPASAAKMLASLSETDKAQADFPIPSFRYLQDAIVLRRRFASFARDNPESVEGRAALEKSRNILRGLREDRNRWFAQLQLRRINGHSGFRERLATFWGDHFTALGKNNLLRLATPIYIDEAVRPHISGKFADLLTSCVTHPLMLHYLDQNTSAGPNSRAALRRKGRLGLNENLAREVLELHTLGVDGPYHQTDVRELAKLLTGLAATRNYGFKFRPTMAEPGSEEVLGQTYSAKASMAPIRAVLNDLAVHPATAAHIAHKLAVHFISDTPPADLVDQVKSAYLETDGNLQACYTALLDHPAAWAHPATNMRSPDEFVSATLRALDVTAATLQGLTPKAMRKIFFRPMTLMGQPWLQPAGPDGFAEEDSAWVTPQGISARMEWAMNAPSRLVSALPDPRIFMENALGDNVPDAVEFAANAAENRAVAIGLILSSPSFQRR